MKSIYFIVIISSNPTVGREANCFSIIPTPFCSVRQDNSAELFSILTCCGVRLFCLVWEMTAVIKRKNSRPRNRWGVSFFCGLYYYNSIDVLVSGGRWLSYRQCSACLCRRSLLCVLSCEACRRRTVCLSAYRPMKLCILSLRVPAYSLSCLPTHR